MPRAELVWLPVVALAAGCAVGPKYHTPPAPVPPAYKEWRVAAPQDAMARGPWWEIFNDAELNALQAQVDAGNQTIAQAYESYMAARALAQQARALRAPLVTTTPSVTRSRSSATRVPAVSSTPTNPAGRETNLFSLPADASWEPDLWGRIRNTIASARFAAQASAADLESVRLAQHAALAQLFFELRGQDSLQQVLDDTVAADRKTVDFARAQYETGIGSRIALVEAETALQTAEAAALDVGVARAQFEHAIAVLVGKPPAELSLPRRGLPDALPASLPPGLPSELLERRPDIAAAERLMAEANAQLGLAYAAYYPTVTLSASGGFESASFLTWLSWPSRLWSIGVSAAETVFDGGQRHAKVQESQANYDGTVAAYRQTVLSAFQQVEDFLAAQRILGEEADKRRQAVASAREFFRLAYDRYQTGLDPYINVLTAQTTLLAAQQSLASVETLRMTSTVQLIAALGGGWNRSQLPQH
jgi:NodT family efflux transporter outer membrane factor (OMF) lipoprotein